MVARGCPRATSCPRRNKGLRMGCERYFLAPSVHWSTVNQFTVVLDVNADRYLSIPAQQFEALLPFLASGTLSSSDTDPENMPPNLKDLADSLLASRILSRQPPRAQVQRCTLCPRPTALISSIDNLPPLTATLLAAPRFFKACAITDFSLRFRPLRDTLARVSARKRNSHIKNNVHTRDTLIARTRTFNALRPFYPRPYLCLFDSLALLEFLCHWELFPSLVFGVDTDPFRAHCWIQDGPLTLCDTLHFSARWYSPIMVI